VNKGPSISINVPDDNDDNRSIAGAPIEEGKLKSGNRFSSLRSPNVAYNPNRSRSSTITLSDILSSPVNQGTRYNTPVNRLNSSNPNGLGRKRLLSKSLKEVLKKYNL